MYARPTGPAAAARRAAATPGTSEQQPPSTTVNAPLCSTGTSPSRTPSQVETTVGYPTIPEAGSRSSPTIRTGRSPASRAPSASTTPCSR